MAYTVPEIARENGIDPKELRRYIRSSKTWNTVGTGRRYTFTERDAKSLIKGFRAWKTSRQGIKSKKRVMS